jgi:hypothetical protein
MSAETVVRTIRQHGTTTAYTYGCRCDECRSASRDYMRGRRVGVRLHRHGGGRPVPSWRRLTRRVGAWLIGL